TTISAMRLNPSSEPCRRRSMSFCSIAAVYLIDANGWSSPCPPLGPVRHHVGEGPPGSPAGLPVAVDGHGPRGFAPPPPGGFAFVKSSVGLSTHPERGLSGFAAMGG